MKIYEISFPLIEDDYQPSVVAIGYFDGVHLGHQQVIKRACQMAKQIHLPCGILTFTPHPKEVLGMNHKIDQITPIDSKLKLIEKLGPDFSYVVQFTKAFAAISPQEFMEQFLTKLNIKGVVVGFDFTFGYKGLGTTETLIEQEKLIVDIVEPYFDNGEKISSTRVRDELISGKTANVKRLLGRNYSFSGRVIHGDKRGRTIGFPTANLQPKEDILYLKKGVYAVKVHFQNQSFVGVMNIGYKPTFEEQKYEPSYEVHILDFQGDLYGEIIEIELIEFLRDEKKFQSVDELKQQILADIHYAKKAIIDLII